MFLPLSLATLGDLPKDKIAAGAGFYNLTRQLGSSIGIAIITTLLVSREAIHRSVLVEHISSGQTATLQRLGFLNGALARHSSDPVGIQHQSMKVLDGIVNAQALLLSFADIFLYVAIAFTASLPLLLLLGKGRRGGPAPAAH